ncbi:MAG: ChaN family lipoprotein [Desulfuromonadales bacterium]|nr:ChaN family lipoprotein [Desulfuromonadales bacterium]
MNRLRPLLIALLLILVTLGASLATAWAHPHIIDAATRQEVDLTALLDDLASVQVVLIGELHNHDGHHRAQLSILRALELRDDRPLALGVEMFRQESQPTLDRWTAGRLPLREFLPVYNDNWSYWTSYRPIFEYVRDQRVKTVGLNIDREVTTKVARNGFASLSDAERQTLGNVVCVVDPAYSDYIRRAMGAHGGEGRQFLFFCEAQLLWDTMMARNIIRFLKENPEYRMVVLAGSAHAWKFGIPRQLAEQTDISYRVLLPEIDVRINRTNLATDLTDYLWLDEGEDGWQF